MKAAVLGTSGYTGMALLRFLSTHPGVEQILPVSSSKAGETVTSIDEGIHPRIGEKCFRGGTLLTVDEAAKEKPDVVFAALPHLKSAEICAPFFGSSVVIDLSADFRIRDKEVFEQAYKQKPPRPDLLSKAVYGLAEIYGPEIQKADLIANPGCYPTCTLLPLIPLAKKDLIRGTVIVNALSGISGAGKKAKVNLIFPERTENTNAYSPGKSHRHSQEIQQEIGTALEIIFTPHLVPLKRGMAVTTAVTLKEGTDKEMALPTIRERYANSPFIRVMDQGIPETGNVWGSNRCDIALHSEGQTLLLFSVIDNLVKGASGQAVQNMNIRFGFDETAGLPMDGAV